MATTPILFLSSGGKAKVALTHKQHERERRGGGGESKQ
jgi:hypothetical protein